MKRFAVLALICVMIFGLCGCDMWMDGSYHSVKRHQEKYTDQSIESAEISDYRQLLSALKDLVRNGSQEGVIYVQQIHQEQLGTYMDLAITGVMKQDAIGAFAVESINYDIGANAGRLAVAVEIKYHRTRTEILRIKHTENMEEAKLAIAEALDNCDAAVVVLVENYENTDFVQLVQSYVDDNPNTCMEMPQVTAAVYPELGKERVVELTFTYQTNRESLRTMQGYVGPVFRAAYLNVSGEESESAKFSLMYSFLMERNDYQLETSITPSYSLLRHGVGDSKAFATVYAAMCRGAGLDCRVVTGTRNGEPWFWNLICEDGLYYYVDLLQSNTSGRLLRLVQENMTAYVWDYSAYPETGPEIVEDEEQEILPEETVPEETQPEPTEPTVEPTQPEPTQPPVTEPAKEPTTEP